MSDLDDWKMRVSLSRPRPTCDLVGWRDPPSVILPEDPLDLLAMLSPADAQSPAGWFSVLCRLYFEEQPADLESWIRSKVSESSRRSVSINRQAYRRFKSVQEGLFDGS